MDISNYSNMTETDTTATKQAISQKVEGGQIQLTQKEALLERKYSTGSMSMLTPNHSLRICGGPEDLTSTIMFKKCGAKTSSGGQKCSFLRTNYELHYHNK